MKRLFDVSTSLFGLLVFSWLIILLAIVVRLTSRGPGIFAQQRVGLNGRPFTCYKLRTMKSDTPMLGTHEVQSSSVTPIGIWLRRLKLDELPQLWNVLKGDMSLVGPRPCLPVQEQLIAERHAHGVFAIRPGITGKAQVLGVDMSDPARLAKIDGEYVATQSFSGDLLLLLQTVTGRGFGDRVAT